MVAVDKNSFLINYLKGVAILMVFISHYARVAFDHSSVLFYICNLGALGVQLFFIVSAYSIYNSYSINQIGYKNFLIKRYFRLAPMLYLAFIINFIADFCGLVLYTHEFTIFHFIQYITLTFIFFPDNINYLVPGSWSLSPEIVFYLIFPFFYKRFNVVGIKKYSVNFLIFASVILCLLFEIICFEVFYAFLNWINVVSKPINNDRWSFFYTIFINHAPAFFIGILVHLSSSQMKSRFLDWTAIFIFIPLAYIFINNLWVHTGYNAFLYPIFGSLFLWRYFLYVLISGVTNGWVNKFMAALGRYSYSFYLLHYVILVVVYDFVSYYVVLDGCFVKTIVMIITFGLSFLASNLTFIYIENLGITFAYRFIGNLHLEAKA